MSVATCRTCGLKISTIDAPPTLSYGAIDHAAYEQSIGILRRIQAESIVRAVRTLVEPPRSWTDVGCGFGFLLAAAHAHGFAVHGIEPDRSACAEARARVGNVECGEFDRVLTDVDVLSTLDVIEHIPPDRLGEFATRVRESLREGGVWVIKVPSSEGLAFRVAHLAPRLAAGAVKRLWQFGYTHPHTVYFNEKSLRAFVTRHGFEVASVRYVSDFPVRTIVPRLRIDASITRWQVPLFASALFAIRAVEGVWRKTDALVMIVRRARS
ncbi:MAG TPA: methyltransferase domain-containing protein [Thermoanaerobaculia bacterium]|nr:methyltransferase domain-containing protein [Thermoanaerobaculia bacterium]